MKIEKADIVIPLNGRDEGKRFLVIQAEEEYSQIADGKNRRVDKPKRKKNKHLKLEDKAFGRIAEKIMSGGTVTNNEIKQLLATYAADRKATAPGAGTDEEGGV